MDHADSVPGMLEQLPSACVHDKNSRTPLNAAIEADNTVAFELLAQSKDALNYVPPIDDDLKRRVRNVVRDHGTDTVEEMEGFVAGIFDDESLHWMRSPLLQACRYGNRAAISKLVENGAKLNKTDLLQYSALELCLVTGGVELVEYLIEACAQRNAKPLVKSDFLCSIAPEPALYATILRYGGLNAQAKNLAFNLGCALLDIEFVSRCLEDGHKLNQTHQHGRDPLAEAATSYLAWVLGHPDSKEVAPGHHRLMANNQPLVFDGADLNSLIADLEQLDEEALGDYFFGEGELDADATNPPVVELVVSGGVNPKLQNAGQLTRRLDLIDVLLEHGYDVGRMKAHQREDLLADVIGLNEPALLQKLVDIGVTFKRDDESIPLAIQLRCFDLVEPLTGLGFTLPEVEAHWTTAYEEYCQWRDAEEG